MVPPPVPNVWRAAPPGADCGEMISRMRTTVLFFSVAKAFRPARSLPHRRSSAEAGRLPCRELDARLLYGDLDIGCVEQDAVVRVRADRVRARLTERRLRRRPATASAAR